jgi:hypothetical protein
MKAFSLKNSDMSVLSALAGSKTLQTRLFWSIYQVDKFCSGYPIRVLFSQRFPLKSSVRAADYRYRVECLTPEESGL